MKNKVLWYLPLLAIVFIFGCSSTETTDNSQTTKIKERPGIDSLYVFDQAAPDTSNKNLEIIPVLEKNTVDAENLSTQNKYTVQVGAFSTLEKADFFASEARTRIKKELSVTFNEQIKLFVVQIIPAFPSKSDAETLKIELRKMKGFEDAWVVVAN